MKASHALPMTAAVAAHSTSSGRMPPRGPGERSPSNAMKIARTLPAPVTRTDTNIITTDSVAMQQLAATLEASNVILTENNILRREEHADREANRQTVKLNTDTLERAIGTIIEARADMRELQREIVRLAERLK